MTIIYRLNNDLYDTTVVSVNKTQDGQFLLSIPIDPANTDYENFKYQINHDEAQLEDADGVLMTSEQAKAYVATLP